MRPEIRPKLQIIPWNFHFACFHESKHTWKVSYYSVELKVLKKLLPTYWKRALSSQTVSTSIDLLQNVVVHRNKPFLNRRLYLFINILHRNCRRIVIDEVVEANKLCFCYMAGTASPIHLRTVVPANLVNVKCGVEASAKPLLKGQILYFRSTTNRLPSILLNRCTRNQYPIAGNCHFLSTPSLPLLWSISWSVIHIWHWHPSLLRISINTTLHAIYCNKA